MIRAGHVIPAVLARIVRQAPLTPEKVAFVWSSTVGPVIERSTRASLQADGVLRVIAADAQWAREIRRSSGLILRRMEPMLGPGTIARIEVTASGASEPKRPRNAQRSPRPRR